MPLTDKDIALDMIEVIEAGFIESTAYHLLLKELNPPHWKERLDALKKSQKESVKALFDPLREMVLHAPSWHEAVHEALEGLEENGPEGTTDH